MYRDNCERWLFTIISTSEADYEVRYICLANVICTEAGTGGSIN